MDRHRVDALARAFATSPTRRALVSLLGALFVAPRASDARKRRKRKKKATLCLDGQTIKASKKKKKKLLKQGATRGACVPTPPCIPNCNGTTCGDDGCGGVCACPAGSICHEGVCRVCTVTCDGNAEACAAVLQARLNFGGTIYVCPGRYEGTFSLTRDVTVIGAGSGEDPATSTILAARNGDRALLVDAITINASLRDLRITGANVGLDGAGIFSRGALTLTNCAVAGNRGVHGGGIYNEGSEAKLRLDGCDVSGNTATQQGGAIYNLGALSLTGGTVAGNTAADGGGAIFNQGSATASGTTFSNNSPDNCGGPNPVTGCPDS